MDVKSQQILIPRGKVLTLTTPEAVEIPQSSLSCHESFRRIRKPFFVDGQKFNAQENFSINQGTLFPFFSPSNRPQHNIIPWIVDDERVHVSTYVSNHHSIEEFNRHHYQKLPSFSFLDCSGSDLKFHFHPRASSSIWRWSLKDNVTNFLSCYGAPGFNLIYALRLIPSSFSCSEQHQENRTEPASHFTRLPSPIPSSTINYRTLEKLLISPPPFFFTLTVSGAKRQEKFYTHPFWRQKEKLFSVRILYNFI